MLKLFKNALYRTRQNTRRLPFLIELQPFASDAARIVNDRPLTTLSDQSNDLSQITSSSFWRQSLTPSTPVGCFLLKVTFAKILFIMPPCDIAFGWVDKVKNFQILLKTMINNKLLEIQLINK